ncbi:MAG TPA: glutathione S-transferase N-terminal domain-containing protein [Aestuariivirgaceae bacterium]|nr:glutathione S-transferase N-terminal domain-containing protein [Aestuariivirgaceae bacterium]
MYDLYTWSTPNGRKISIALEEMELPYTVHTVNIDTGEQFLPAFTKISPNQKIPAIVDRETGLSVFESGAILMYLGDKHGKLFPSEGEPRLRAIEWMMWQMSAIGPFLGRAHFFLRNNAGKAPFAEEWFAGEAQRLYRVLEKQLEKTGWVTGDYSIVDIATFPWIARYSWQRVSLNDFPNVKDWYQRIAARPAVIKGYSVPDPKYRIPSPD